MDAILYPALIVLFLVIVGWRLVSMARDLRNDPSQRAAAVALLIALAAAIPVFVALERFTGKSPSAPEPSYAIRRGTVAVAFVAWAVFVAWRGYREHVAERTARLRERQQFAEGKQCAVCGKPLNLNRLHHPLRDGQEMKDGWMNVCDQCGELTFFDASGRGRRVEDLSRDKHR